MIGKKLGQYEITEEVGQGGMATVYRAYHKSMDRHVAIKIIRSNILSDKVSKERFQREAKLIAKLEHPHLLPVYDFEGKSVPPYIVMRFLEGGTLKQVIEKGNLPLGESLYMLRQIASALDYAHRQGVVHRDLKPSNIMIDKEGNAFVADFGIARIEEAEGENLTETGAAVGTPAYMAPEQAVNNGNLDHRIDVYALGVIIFEILAGEHPFPKESPIEVLMAHIQEPVPDIQSVNKNLPESLNKVFHKVLAKKPDDRFSSASELVEAISSKLNADPSKEPAQLRQMTESFAADQLAAMLSKAEGRSQTGTSSREHQRQMTAVYLDASAYAEVLYETGEPDAVRKTVDNLWDSLSEIAVNHGGILESRTGESGLLLWGREGTQESDPEQAIRAALAMKELIEEETPDRLGKSDEPLPFKAGISTGPILLTREGDSGTYTTSGVTMTLASRLKDSAPPGEILIAHDTFTHGRGIFNMETLPPIRMRGRTDPIEVYVVKLARARAFRIQSRGIEGIETKMIGRDNDLKLLQDSMQLAIEDKETQVVTVIGDAGVGKSRLLFEFTNWVDLIGETLWFFEARATQPSQVQPFSLTRDLFSFRFQISDNDLLSVVHKKFIQGIEGFLGKGSEEKARFIGQLVGFDFSEDPAVNAAMKDNKESFQQTALDYLGDFFTTAAKINPLFIQVEDIHWADDKSLDLLNDLARLNPNLPLFIIYMARPGIFERRASWGEGQLFHHKLQLEPLTRLDSRRLVRELLKKVEEVPVELRDMIIDRAEGNPFFAEELIKSLIDDHVILKGEEVWTLDMARFRQIRVPQTLTGVLQGRLDTLEEAQRALLQRASVVGRIFWESSVIHLSNVDGVNTSTTASLLDGLREREMILKREESNFEGTNEYLFRHAILRDVTYESIVPHQRRTYHKLMAEWLVKIAGERIDEYTPLIAEHYEAAHEIKEAVHYIRLAAFRIFNSGGTKESINLIDKALGMFTVEENPNTWIQTYLIKAYSLYGIGKFGNLIKDLEEIEPIAETLTDLEVKADFFIQFGRAYMVRGDSKLAKINLEKGLRIARETENRLQEAIALRQLGNVAQIEGDVSASIDYAEKSKAIGEELNDNDLILSALNSLGNIYSTKPETYQKALEIYNHGYSLAIEHSLSHFLLYIFSNRTFLHIRMGNYDLAIQGSEETITLATQQGNTGFIGAGYGSLAEAYIFQEDFESARQNLAKGLKISVELDSPIFVLEGIKLAGALLLAEKNNEKGMAWFGMVIEDDRTIEDTKNDIIIYQKTFAPEISDSEWEEGLAKGKDLKIKDVVDEILNF